jgi:hypothetical protein
MRRPGSSRRMMLWFLSAALLGLVAAVVVLPRVVTGPSRPPTPVTDTRSVDGRRERDIRFTNEYLYDSAYETCDALAIDTLADRLRVPATGPSAVARAFARQNFATALRAGPYNGCRDALESHLHDPRRWRGVRP